MLEHVCQDSGESLAWVVIAAHPCGLEELVAGWGKGFKVANVLSSRDTAVSGRVEFEPQVVRAADEMQNESPELAASPRSRRS